MRTRSILIGAALLSLAVAAPANAGKPVRGCGNEGFDPMLYADFRQLSLDVGVPAELLGADHHALWLQVDKNDDDIMCVKDLKDTPGHLGSWIYNIVDNTSNH